MRSLFLLAAVVLSACGSAHEADRHADHGAPDLAGRVSWEAAAATDRVVVATLPAEVVARPGGRVQLAPPDIGRLDRWAVQPGDAVQAGQVLAWLTSPELSSRLASLEAAEAQIAVARLAAEQADRAADRGVRAQADADLALANLEAVTAGRDALSRSLTARRDTTRRGADGWAWTSPTDGVVQTLTCDVGTVVPSTGCVSLVRAEGTWVRVGVPERYGRWLDAGGLSGVLETIAGDTVELAWASTAPAYDPHTRARATWFVAPEPLIQGSTGRLRLVAPAPDGATEVPAAALTRVEGRPAVLRRADGASPTHAADVVEVEVLGRSPGRVMVSGLAPGDPVAVKGLFLLKSLLLIDDDAGHVH